ncbi:hypothetical protein OPQ81_002590 [Rhizoctonia solani]|nr:hypothetical protein OPQ81_002590 [Rhizoctonia solani]
MNVRDLSVSASLGLGLKNHSSGVNSGSVGEVRTEDVCNDDSGSVVDSDYYLSDEDDDKYIKALLRRQQRPEPDFEVKEKTNEKTTPVSHPSRSSVSSYLTTRTLSVLPNPQPSNTSHSIDTPNPVTHFERHLLVDLETDVIPTVCALTQRFPKVICYIQCALPSIMTYYRIIKHVTESIVYAVTRPSISQSDNTWGAFTRQGKVIILLPETLSSNTPLQAVGNICVIHVGWPSSVQRYRSQLALHDAPYSALVACIQDKQIFPSCEELIGETVPWPLEDQQLLANEVSRLFPKYEAAIMQIPLETKDKFYHDWIEAHGPRGQRYVSTWDSVALVNRANLYISDVLGYNRSGNDWSMPRFPLAPHLFVSRNGLDDAVNNGILSSDDRDSGLNHRMDLPNDVSPISVVPPEEPSLSEITRPMENRTMIRTPEPKKSDSKRSPSPLALDSGRTTVSGSNVTNLVAEGNPVQLTTGTNDTPQISPEDTNKTESTSKQVSAQTNMYFVVPEEFHLIPAICILAKDKSYKNVICYVQIVGVFQTLINQIYALTSKPIFIIASPNSASLPRALKALDSHMGCIIVCNYLLPLFEPLRAKPIHRIIHAGWTGKLDLYYQQIDTISDTQNSIIMTQSQYSAIPDPETVFGPSRLNIQRSVFDASSLDLLVSQWESQLNHASEKALNGCYMEWIAYHGRGQYKVEKWSTVELVSQANTFAGNVLKRKGDRGTLAASEGLVRHLKLQPAVQSGVLRVTNR